MSHLWWLMNYNRNHSKDILWKGSKTYGIHDHR